ncbi:unnamed protein product [Cochlearia groenlandica]
MENMCNSPFMFFGQSSVPIHLLEFFGLKSSSSESLLSSHSEEEEGKEIKEEENDMSVEITERKFQKSKPTPKPKPSSGKGGKIH